MVTALICRGLTDGQIAQELALSPDEVRHRVGEIYGKLGIRSRQELIDTVARVEFFVAGLSAATQELISPGQIGDPDGYQLKPDPLEARSMAELEDFVRKLWVWAGMPSSRRLAAGSGGAFSHATISKLVHDKTGKPALKLQYLIGFIRACGTDEDEQKNWVTAWRKNAGSLLASDQHDQRHGRKEQE